MDGHQVPIEKINVTHLGLQVASKTMYTYIYIYILQQVTDLKIYEGLDVLYLPT